MKRRAELYDAHPQSTSQTAPWKSAQVLVPLLVGIGFFFVFCYHQIFVKKDGLLNHAMFKGRRNGQ